MRYPTPPEKRVLTVTLPRALVERLDRITTSQAAPLVERYGNPTRTDVVIESLLVGAAYLESQASVTAETRPTDKPAAVGLDENEDWLTGDLL